MQYPESNEIDGVSIHPTRMVLHQNSKYLEVDFGNNELFKLSFELLRVFSPSAEVRGHGPGQEVLQTGKREVNIIAAEPIGLYAVKFVFDDGHDSGIYTWRLLYQLGSSQELYWQGYLAALAQAGASRDVDNAPPKQPTTVNPSSGSGCGGCGCGGH